MEEFKRAMSQAFTSQEDILNFFKTRGFEETNMTKENFCRLLDHLLPGKFPAQVVETLCDSLIKFDICIKIHNFNIMSTHTLINLNNLIENCIICSQKNSELMDQITVISTISKRILSFSGSRFVLSKLLVKNFETI